MPNGSRFWFDIMCDALWFIDLMFNERLQGQESSGRLLRMAEGIYRRSSSQGRRRQQGCNSNQSFVQPSKGQRLGRPAVALVGCLFLCFVTWALSRLRSPSLISTESLHHHAPSRAVVFELFRYYRDTRAKNRSSFSVPVRRGRRGLLEYEETKASTPQESILNDEEQKEQPVDKMSGTGGGDGLSVDITALKKRSPVRHTFDESLAFAHGQQASPPPQVDAIRECPIFGGARASDTKIESLFVKVGLGGGSQMREYFLGVDTGSGGTWVNCMGIGPIVEMGPNGLFYPKRDSFLHCKNNEDICKPLQEGVHFPCNNDNNFRCYFDYVYGDDTEVEGSIVMGEVSFKLSDGSQKQANVAFGCAEKVTMEGEPENAVQRLVPFDGLLGLGPNAGGWLPQLNLLGVISEHAIAICLEPEIGHLNPGPDSSILEQVGFLSIGDSYSRQAPNIAWTASVPPASGNPLDSDNLFSAMLVGFKYRDEVHVLGAGEEMGFDTGSILTYLTREIFDSVLDILNQDAIGMGYVGTPDREFGSGGRNCWRHGTAGRESLVEHFGDLIMMFSSPGDDKDTSDFVIKPEHYITSGGSPEKPKICFNMIPEPETEGGFQYGNIGGEAMRGHLLVFKEHYGQMNPSGLIGWTSVATCTNLR